LHHIGVYLVRSSTNPQARKTKTNLNILGLLTYKIINLILPSYKYSVCCSSVMVRNRKSTFHSLLEFILIYWKMP